MPGSSSFFGFATVASICTLRVAVSTFAIDRRHLAAECLSRVSIAQYGHRLAHQHPADLLLWQIEVDVDRIDGLQRHDLVARIEVLARVHEGDAEPPRKRRANRLLVDDGLLAGSLGALALQVGFIAVDLRLGDCFGSHLHAVAGERGLRQVGGRLQRSQLRQIGIRIELDQNRARLDSRRLI